MSDACSLGFSQCGVHCFLLSFTAAALGLATALFFLNRSAPERIDPLRPPTAAQQPLSSDAPAAEGE